MADEFRFLTCFSCRTTVSPFDVAHGPMCGPVQQHPHCADVVWHETCRADWLDGLAVWADVVGTLSLGVDTERGNNVGTVRAPFTDRQVAELNRYQVADIMHPFTCPNDGHVEEIVLLATSEGWHCPVRGCGYRQDWAHSFMADA